MCECVRHDTLKVTTNEEANGFRQGDRQIIKRFQLREGRECKRFPIRISTPRSLTITSRQTVTGITTC